MIRDYVTANSRHLIERIRGGEGDTVYARAIADKLREFRPLLEYLDKTDEEHGDGQLATVVLPEFVPARWWHALLHNQTAWLIKAALPLGFVLLLLAVLARVSRVWEFLFGDGSARGG